MTATDSRQRIPMGIQYRNPPGARPSEPVPAKPAWAQALAAMPTELLEDMDSRPAAKGRRRRTTAAADHPTPASRAPEPVLAGPHDLDVAAATPAAPQALAEPVPESAVDPAPVEPAGEPAPVEPQAAPSPVEPAAEPAPEPSCTAAESAAAQLVVAEPGADEPDGEPETVEQILARADACPSEQVQSAAAALREQVRRLGEALQVDEQAGGLREQIAALDAEIADRTARRDALRAELEALLAGGVTVSATAGSVSPAKPRPAEVRAWARENGYQIGDSGVIPGGILAAYQRQHGGTR